MENVLNQIELPKEVIEVQEALPLPEPEPANNNLRDAGIVVAVIVAAAVCAKLYKCTARKK